MIKTICVCGAGTMGSGIAQVAAMAGLKVMLFDISESMLNKSKANILSSLEKGVQKALITKEESMKALEQIAFTSHLKDCTADIVIEAITEKVEAKVELFNQLAQFNSSETVLATNTSSLSINHIAAQVNNPSRVIGMHFFNPAPIMKLVEIVVGDSTTQKVVTSVTALARLMGKTPVECKDSPGFIVNRVARPYYLEALRLLESGLGDIETIDQAMEAAGFKLGPFRLMDLIGMDVNYSVTNSVWEALDKPGRLIPSSIQKTKVDAGELGRKSGKGFYDHTK